MTIDELITSLTNDIESKNFILQVVFDRHINGIEKFKSQGITYKRIMELLNNEVSKEFKKANFNTLIFRAKQKIKTSQVVESKTEIKPVLHVEKESLPKAEFDLKVSDLNSEGLKQSLEEWMLETNINIPERLALRLESNGINTDKLNEFGFTTIFKISKYLTQIEQKNKYRS